MNDLDRRKYNGDILAFGYVIGIVFATLFVPARVHAQQASPAEQALSGKLSQEISMGLQCGAGLIAAQAKIKELEDKLKATEAKPEDKK